MDDDGGLMWWAQQGQQEQWESEHEEVQAVPSREAAFRDEAGQEKRRWLLVLLQRVPQGRISGLAEGEPREIERRSPR